MPTPTIPDEIDTDDAPEEEDEDDVAMRSKNLGTPLDEPADVANTEPPTPRRSH